MFLMFTGGGQLICLRVGSAGLLVVAAGGLVTKTLNIETCGERPAAGLPSDNPSACGESQLQCQVSKYNPVIM